MIIVMGDDIFGKNLRRWRKKRHMSRLGLAIRSGVTYGELRRFETGQLREVTDEDMRRLAEALGTTMEELIEGGRM